MGGGGGVVFFCLLVSSLLFLRFCFVLVCFSLLVCNFRFLVITISEMNTVDGSLHRNSSPPPPPAPSPNGPLFSVTLTMVHVVITFQRVVL